MDNVDNEILFVCTGNLCRSPLAEGLFKKLLSEDILARSRIHSAGTGALNEREAAALAIEVARENGFDIAGHRAKTLKQEDVEDADFILVMEKSQRDYITRRFENSHEKIYLLKSFSGKKSWNKDIPDPYGYSIEKYRSSYDIIEKGVRGFIQYLEKHDYL